MKTFLPVWEMEARSPVCAWGLRAARDPRDTLSADITAILSLYVRWLYRETEKAGIKGVKVQ